MDFSEKVLQEKAMGNVGPSPRNAPQIAATQESECSVLRIFRGQRLQSKKRGSMFEAVSGIGNHGMAGRRRLGSLMVLLTTLLLTLGSSAAEAKPKPANTVSVIPTIQSVSIQNGQLVAQGVATALIRGRSYTAPFSAPVNIGLAADQSAAAAAGCPILDLALGPINLNLLGL